MYQEFKDVCTPEENEAEQAMRFSRALPLLNDLYESMKYENCLLKNIFTQLSALYPTLSGNNNSFSKDLKEMIELFKPSLPSTIFDITLEILGHFAIVDAIINRNDIIKTDIKMYKRLLLTVGGNKQKFSVNDKQLRRIESKIKRIDNLILSGCMLKRLFNQSYNVHFVISQKLTSMKEFRGLPRTRHFRNYSENTLKRRYRVSSAMHPVSVEKLSFIS